MTDNLAVSDERVNKCGYVVVSNVSGQIVPDFHSFDYGEALLHSALEVPGSTVKPWMEAHVEELTRKGYHLTPAYFINGERTNSAIKDGQTYPLGHKNWSYATEISSVVPKDCVMIDWDGDKPDAATVEDVATALGLTVEELDKARIQHRRKGEKASIHWLFRLPENTPVKTCANEWLSRVDIRANTDHPQGSKHGLIDIKPGKIINLPHVDKIVKLDVSCVAVPFPKHDDNVDRTKTPMPTGANVEEVRDALTFIDPDCEHDDWKSVGMALQAEFGDSGLSLWDEWSSKGAKYPGTRHLSDKYRTFKPKAGGVSVKTLFKMARDGGWNSRKVIDAATVFGAPTLPATSPVVREGFQWIPAQQLAEFFAGCIYIASEHAVLMPNGSRLKPEAFNAIKGGYIFGMDAEGNKSTDKAFDAFTRNRCITLPKVINTHFAPEKPFGSVDIVDGIESVNTYLPCPGMRKAGDVTPFLNHIEKLLPVEADRDILLNWMAYKVQHPGECMRWAPVLVGAPGNGKTTVADVMSYAIGHKYVSVVQSSDVENKFNGWAYEKCLAVINDFKVGDKRDVMEVLKPMITDKRIPVQKKGTDTVTSSNHLGFIITSNHRDAVVKTSDDRRYAVFFTAQNNESDILRDGMDDKYFVQLNDWLESDGYAAVAEYLSQRHVESHPNRAPETSSMAEAIRESMTPAQAAILEAAEDGRPGFCNNIIVAAAARWVLENSGVKITHGKVVGRVLRELGYEPIPNSESWKINGNRFSPWAKCGTIPANTTLSKEEVVRLSGYIDNRALAMVQH
ncbi:TPA: PriCT-2 domain-containing protein [Escherichia coli]|uniref:Uncharacterized protein n=1 Tax=Escherichia coli TaxID=562 RepID=A0A5P0JGV2_ECOLX|nr:DUF5906 domain-containing protein [Escherichia coli]MQK27263.1 hypothetical protein [Escherichia coli]HBN1669712.1 PriCT-2 domain-containing protein [Escherichia coli]